jgi:membrane-bound serine protease (ClpP class)
MTRLRVGFSRLLPLLVLLASGASGPAAAGPPDSTANAAAPGFVLWARMDDVVGPITAGYLTDAIKAANQRNANALVIEMDTPGGLDTAMRQIIKAILASDVPVCVYVAPNGARAASAGVYITYSAQVAAMAPGTNLGAATPVNLGGGMDSTMAHKVQNDAEAYIRSLARLRGRNETWAAEAVRKAVSLPSHDAVKEHVVDFIAQDPRQLLQKMNGLTVKTAADSSFVIHTAGAEIREYPMSFRYQALSILNNPNVAYMLLLLGFYGLFFELSSPGAIFPGVLGGIALILGLFALQSLSVNYAGLLLMALGVLLFFLETQVASHGILAIGGTVSLLAGSLLLIDAPEPYLRVSLKVIIPAVAASAAFFIFAITMALRAQARKVVTGSEGLVGSFGVVRTPVDPEGKVFVAGEHWTALSATGAPIPQGARVVVVSVDRLKVVVKPVGDA